MLRRFSMFLLALACVLVLVQCGEDSGSDAITTATEGLFPTDLAVASPTATSSRSLQSIRNSETPALLVSSSSTAAEKTAAVNALLEATSLTSCTVSLSNFDLQSGRASCYGRDGTYTNHPDGSTPNSGNIPGGDTGIWDATNARSEACAAAQLTSVIGNVANQIDTMIFLTAIIKCVMNANSIDEPGSGSSVSVATQMNTAFSTLGLDLSVTDASLAQSTNSDDQLVNVWTFKATKSRTKSINIRLNHIDTTDGYKGKLSYNINDDANSAGGNCSSTGFVDASSLKYEKTSDTSLTYELSSAQFCGSSTDPYTSSTNYTVKSTDWANNYNYALINYNPSTQDGNYLVAWQAGVNDRATRAFNVNIATSRDGRAQTGTAYFGFGPSTSSGNSLGGISGMFCNWSYPGASQTASSLMQKQVMTRSDSSSQFTPTTSNITFSITNNCNHPGNGQANPFSYTINSTTYSSAFNNNLVSPDTNTVTRPTAPTDVDA